jgi:RNA polymerase sigma factor (sigma-70 family)
MKEKELIERLIKKDPIAVRDMVAQYNRRLFNMVLRVVGQKEDVEDVLQEAWIKFFGSLHRFQARSSLYTYLYRIVINEAMLHLRRNKFKKLFVRDYKEPGHDHTPERIYLENEKWELVEEAVKELPARQKQVFLMRRSEDLSFREIGEVLDITENNAKVLFFYGLKRIRAALKKRGAL